MEPCCRTFRPVPFPGMASLDDDRALLQRAAAGDEAAFNELFERHRDGLRGFLFRKLHSLEDAEDAVTATFYNAWRARASFSGRASGKAWLYQIATRVALDVLRRRRRTPPLQELDALEPESLRPAEDELLDPVAVVLDREQEADTRTALERAIHRLPADERRLLQLFYYDGYNYEEISDLLGVSRSQVRGRLHRIRSRLRRDLLHRQQWQPC